MKRNYIGASHVEPWRILAGATRTKGAPIDPDNTGTVLGFRLVADTEADRVYRGGGWFHAEQLARAARRNWNDPTYRYNRLGFRLARDGEDT